jgi:hypothetical protein
MLILDGIKYKLHDTKDEKELEEMVKEHFPDILSLAGC